MASGRLGTARLDANVDTVIYTVPASTLATVNISCVNLASNAGALVKIALSMTDVPADADYIEMTSLEVGDGMVECTGIMMSAGERVIVRADSATVAVRVHGIEEAA